MLHCHPRIKHRKQIREVRLPVVVRGKKQRNENGPKRAYKKKGKKKKPHCKVMDSRMRSFIS